MIPTEIAATDVACEDGYEKVLFGKDSEYKTLPALYNGKAVITKWELSNEEIKEIFDNRAIFLRILSSTGTIQPVLLATKIQDIT